MQRSSLTLFLAALVAFAAAAVAEDPSCGSRTIPVEVISNKPRVLAPSNTAFRAELDGRPLLIESIAPRLGARRVVIALDTSGSMGAVWPFALSTVKDLVVSIPTSAPIALIAQSSQLKETVNFGRTSRRDILVMVERFAADSTLPAGQTPLMSEIDRAFSLLTPPQPGDEIFVISDGADNASKEAWDHLAKRVSAAGVRVSTLLVLPTQVPSSDEERMGPAVFDAFAAATGGHSIVVNADRIRKDPRLKAAYVSAVLDVARDHGWLVTLKTSSPPDKIKSWKLQVLDDDGKPAKHVDLFYSRWWPPCGKSD